MSLDRCVSVSVVEISQGGSATNRATLSSFFVDRLILHFYFECIQHSGPGSGESLLNDKLSGRCTSTCQMQELMGAGQGHGYDNIFKSKVPFTSLPSSCSNSK